jgi:hypothetical protein
MAKHLGVLRQVVPQRRRGALHPARPT